MLSDGRPEVELSDFYPLTKPANCIAAKHEHFHLLNSILVRVQGYPIWGHLVRRRTKQEVMLAPY